MDLLSTLPSTVNIVVGERTISQKVVYIDLPHYCINCSSIGHLSEKCEAGKNMKENKDKNTTCDTEIPTYQTRNNDKEPVIDSTPPLMETGGPSSTNNPESSDANAQTPFIIIDISREPSQHEAHHLIDEPTTDPH